MYAEYYFLNSAQINGRSVVNTFKKIEEEYMKTDMSTKANVDKIIVSFRGSSSEDDNDVTQRRLQ